MKKILAILCGATMMFAACTPGGEEGVTPIFPESQSFELLAGAAQRLVFDANTAWTVSLENDYYAQLSYNNGEGTVFDTEVSGVAGEGITVRVIMNEVIKNYDADVVFPVYIKMGSTTQTLATITVKQIERPAAISLPYSDPDVTFEEGGHPNWSPFKSAQHTYHMNYASQWVIEGVRLDCGLETDYSIKTYAYTEGASDPVDFTTREDSWLTITDGLGENGKGFMVAMDLSKESAQWSWFDTQYESYVNFEDSEGNVLVSIFCTSTYKPGQTGGEASVVSLISEYASTAGVSLTGSGNQYTLTFSDPMAFEPYMKNMAGFKIENCGQINFENEGYGILKLNKEEDTESGLGTYYYISFTEAVTDPYAIDIRECAINAFTSDWSAQYTINVVLDWVAGSSTTGGDVTINEMASQLGVIFEELTTSDADYDVDWGIEKQYRLTYNSMAAFTMPSYASLTIPGFAMGTPMGSINGVQAYEMFLFSLDQESGQVLLAPNTESGYSAENIPNGKVDLICYNDQYEPIVRILLVINVAQ